MLPTYRTRNATPRVAFSRAAAPAHGFTSHFLNMSDKADPATWGVTLQSAKLNGITQRWADTASTDAERALPVILFMHGWPESWFSWRHQLKACAAAGFRGIAPDMRGYGGTSAPTDVASYNCYVLAADMLALLQHVGAATAALVGHDHGANTGWTLSLLHPDVFTIYCAMSVPYSPRRPDGPAPIEGMRRNFGDEREPSSDPGFFYILHHQLPEATQQYEANSRDVLLTLYGDPASAKAPPEVTTDRMFVDGEAKGMWARQPTPMALQDYISAEELEYVIEEFETAGWNGGLNWVGVIFISFHGQTI
jgi:pimeloyl-ACP methyl ester carboxylesterase